MAKDWLGMGKIFVVFKFTNYTVGKGQKPQDDNMRTKNKFSSISYKHTISIIWSHFPWINLIIINN